MKYCKVVIVSILLYGAFALGSQNVFAEADGDSELTGGKITFYEEETKTSTSDSSAPTSSDSSLPKTSDEKSPSAIKKMFPSTGENGSQKGMFVGLWMLTMLALYLLKRHHRKGEYM